VMVAGLLVSGNAVEVRSGSSARKPPPSLGVPFAGTPAGSCRWRARG